MKITIAKIVVAIMVILFLINFTAAKVYNLNAFEVELDLKLSAHPVTIIDFPPIGRIKGSTHKFPINLKLTLMAIYQERLEGVIDEFSSKQELIDLLTIKVKTIIQLFIIRLVVIAILGGIIGASIISFDRHSIIIGTITAIIVVLVFALSTYYSYDINAFNDPNFEGMLAAAPWMIGLIQEGLDSIDQLGYEMQLIASNMAELFSKVETLRPLSRVAGDLKILHISDIHNNPVALPFVEEIVKSFGVDVIIDTGDITDYGTPLEGELLNKINHLEIPYIFIGGNHDSPEIVEEMNQFENVIVLQSDVVNIKGLVIAGIEDPAAQSNQIAPVEEDALEEYQRGLEALVQRLDVTPDIVIIHNYKVADRIIGKIPLLLHGHDHSFKIYEVEDTTVIDAGTTGAAGLRGLQSEEGIPYSVALLHYDKLEKKEKWMLNVIDIIKFYDRHSGFILERKLIDNQNKVSNIKENIG